MDMEESLDFRRTAWTRLDFQKNKKPTAAFVLLPFIVQRELLFIHIYTQFMN